MKTKGFWVIKTSGGEYWCRGSFDTQLRKAYIYRWKEKAEKQIEELIRKRYFTVDVDYSVIAVAEPKELKDTEAEWLTVLNAPVEYACSNCYYSALNDYRGNSVDSHFCPHCGKRMINSTMPEDEEDEM